METGSDEIRKNLKEQKASQELKTNTRKSVKFSNPCTRGKHVKPNAMLMIVTPINVKNFNTGKSVDLTVKNVAIFSKLYCRT